MRELNWPTLTTADIRSELDRYGYCCVPPGEHSMDGPIHLGPDQRLTGPGRLVWRDPATLFDGAFGVVMGHPEEYNYRCYVSSIRLVGGGILLRRYGQHCGVSHIHISRPPGEGVKLAGPGDCIVIDDVHVEGAGAAGFAVHSAGANNAITFRHCGAQGCRGAGVEFRPSAPTGKIEAAQLVDCALQANYGAAEVLVEGWVNLALRGSTWIEPTKPGVVGVLTRSATFVEPRGKTIIRHPWDLELADSVTIAVAPTALRIESCNRVHLDALRTKGQIEYAAYQNGQARRYYGQINGATGVIGDTAPPLPDPRGFAGVLAPFTDWA